MTEETLIYRKKEFKKGIDSDLIRRQRGDEAYRIRKEKRTDILTKRRQPCHSETRITVESDHLFSDNPETVLKGLKNLRSQLASSNPPIEEVIKSGWVPKIVNYLSYVKYPDHQKEAAWILSNLVSGTSEHTDYVLLNTPLINYISEAFKIPNHELKEQCVWCISNIAGESENYRNMLVQNGTFDNFVNSFQYELNCEKRSLETIRVYTWCLSNFLLYYIPLTNSVLAIFEELININDEKILKDVIWTIAIVSKKLNYEEMKQFLKFNIITQDMLKNLLNDDLVLPLLRICGNFIAGPADVTQIVLNLGLMSYLPSLLTKTSLDVEVCWILSNIAAGNFNQIQEILDANIISLIIHYLSYDKMDLKKECIYVVCNIVFSKDEEQVQYIVSSGSVPALCDLLASYIDNKLKGIILGVLLSLCEMGYKEIIEEHGLVSIEILQYNPDDSISRQANAIVDNYF